MVLPEREAEVSRTDLVGFRRDGEAGEGHRAEADRAAIALKIAETRIEELEREIVMLRYYRDVVEAALADES